MTTDTTTATSVIPSQRGAGPRTTTVRGFRPDVEGLRALAVLSVLLYHANVPLLTGGFVGVDVFFVISGFLITTLLVAEISRTGKVSVVDFYARRAKRLLPLAAVVVVATLVATYLIDTTIATRDFASDALWSAGFVMNIHLALSGVDYQAGEAPSALQHFWSLAVEEQFYVVWPVLLLLLARPGRGRAGVRRRRTALVVGLVAVVSFVYCVHETRVASSMAYFLTPARAWELAAGGLLAVGAPRLARWRFLRSSWFSVAGLAMVLVSCFTFTDTTVFPGPWAAVPVVGSCLVIASGLTRANRVETWVLGRQPAQLIGKISYGWYLWHWPLLILALTWFDEDELTLPQALAMLVVALWLAVASYVAFEDPLRGLAAFRRFPWRAIATGAVASGVVVASSSAAIAFIPDVRGNGAAAAALSDLSSISSEVEAGAATAAVPSNLDPALEIASKDKPNESPTDGISCHVDLTETAYSSEPGGQCIYGDPRGSKTVVLVGDSHMFQWLPGFVDAAKENDWRLISMTKGGCAFYDVTVVNTKLKREYTECTQWRKNVWERLETEKPDLVVTAAAVFSERKGDLTQRWVAGVTSTVTRLRGLGATVVSLQDTPYPRKDVPKCVAQHIDDVRPCVLTRAEALSDPDRRIGTANAAAAAGATVIDPTNWFCGSTSCPVIVGNTLLYHDNSHITTTYSRQVTPLILEKLPTF